MNVLEARRRLLGRNVYKKTVEGNPAVAQGSLARRGPGITMQGWTEQNRYEGKNLFNLVDLLSLIPENGSDTVNVRLNVTGLKPNTNYTLSSTIEGDVDGDYTNRCLYVGSIKSDDSVFAGHPVSKSSGDGGKITVYFYPFRDISQGIKSGSGNVQLEEGTVVTTYEPYTGGQPSPNPDYPQEIVSAGTQNQETGKWEYEITITNAQTDPDKNQTVTLTADRPLTKWDKLTKKDGQWGWEYGSAEIEITEESPLQKYAADKISLYVSDAYLFGTPYSDKYVCQNGVPVTENRIGLSSGNHAFVIYDTAYLGDVELYKQWLSENPLTLWYETDTKTFVPLSEAEQAALNALHTNRPTTVLSNDCDCNMTLTYKTKKSLEVTD